MNTVIYLSKGMIFQETINKSFKKYLLSTYYMPVIVLSAGKEFNVIF